MIGEHEDINRDWNGLPPQSEQSSDIGGPSAREVENVWRDGQPIFEKQTVINNFNYFIRLISDKRQCNKNAYDQGFINGVLWCKSLFDGVTPDYVQLEDKGETDGEK